MEWEQERYDLKRQLDSAQASCRYLEEDLENLQKEVKEKAEKLQEYARLLKGTTELQKSSEDEWKSKLERLEDLLESEKKKHSVDIKKLEDEIESAKSTQNNHDASCFLERQMLKEDIDEFELNKEKQTIEIQQLLVDKAELVKQNEELIEMKNDLERALHCKRDELSSYIERCTALQEEVVLLKVENDAFKVTPQSHLKKGNSAFAEVDDNRRDLKKSFEEMSKKYNESKKVIKSKSLEVSKLRAEKSCLLKKVQEISTNYETHESKLINDYKIRIKDLESNVEDLRRELKLTQTLPTNGASDDFKKVDLMFALNRKEIETLKKKIENLSQNKILQSEANFFLKRDLESKTAEVAYLLSEKMRLEEQLNIPKDKE